jgi:hypothetical protein
MDTANGVRKQLLMNQTRATCRLGKDKCDPKNLAQWNHCVARHSELDAHAISERLGVGYEWFVKRTSENGRCETPAWLMLALHAITGRDEHIAYLAREAGLITYSPHIGPRAATALSPMLRAFAAFVETFEDAHADNRITADEAHELTQRAHALTAELFSRVSALRQSAGLDSEVAS